MFGQELIEAFREFKSIWDPDWKMNPGKIVDPYRIDQNLRLGADYHPWEPPTHFQYPQRLPQLCACGAALRGYWQVPQKRFPSREGDTMCPSFMVTHEERHTTRGRAHHLWEMLHGDVITEGWRDEKVKEALDLCLACKGCKGDCPVNVDMATYKAEFLSHYWEGRVRPRHAYAFGLDRSVVALGIALAGNGKPGHADTGTQRSGKISCWHASPTPHSGVCSADLPQLVQEEDVG